MPCKSSQMDGQITIEEIIAGAHKDSAYDESCSFVDLESRIIRKAMECSKERNTSERICNLRFAAYMRLTLLLKAYSADNISMRLLNVICDKKLRFIASATTKAEIEAILTPPHPKHDGNRIVDNSPYHIDEEELWLWSMVSLRYVLGDLACRRMEELFRRVYPEYGDDFFGKTK